jgi:hypothetical protein
MAVFALVSCVCAACWRIVRFALHCFKLVFAAAFLPVASTWCVLAGTASYLLHMNSCRSQHKVHASFQARLPVVVSSKMCMHLQQQHLLRKCASSSSGRWTRACLTVLCA